MQYKVTEQAGVHDIHRQKCLPDRGKFLQQCFFLLEFWEHYTFTCRHF